jgi:hypothetical protein
MAEDRRTISGHAFLVYDGASSGPQNDKKSSSFLPLRASTLRDAVSGGKEALWLRSLIFGIFGDLDLVT